MRILVCIHIVRQTKTDYQTKRVYTFTDSLYEAAILADKLTHGDDLFKGYETYTIEIIAREYPNLTAPFYVPIKLG